MMKSTAVPNRILIVIGLGLLMISAFFIRKDTFLNSPARSIDEVVYYDMANRISEEMNLNEYNSNAIGQKLVDMGREHVPSYFFKPLFKHPPLFTLFLSTSFKVFGVSKLSAFYVPVFLSLLMIPLVYQLGRLVYSPIIGFLAAILVAFDPLSVICSQKIWMESLISIMTIGSLYFGVKAVKTNNRSLFIPSGILSGLGALTKYTGGISTLILVIYAGFFDRKLFKDRNFIIGLILPVLLLAPWFAWNLSLYGGDYVGMQVEMHSDKGHSLKFLRNIALYIFAAFALLRLFTKLKEDLGDQKTTVEGIRIFISAGLVVLFFKSILSSFNAIHIPMTSWAGAPFYASSHTFYIDRLLEFSLIYFFGLLTFFLPTKNIAPEEKLIRIGIVTILLFFTMWNAFQSRYIIAVCPLLILVGVKFLADLYGRACQVESLIPRILARSTILVVWILILVKVFYINTFVCCSNDFCYF